MNEHLLLWFDLETTGLDEHSDFILEVGWGISKLDLEWVIEPLSELVHRPTLKIEPDQITLAGHDVDPFVVDMHRESGLWDEMAVQNHRNALSEGSIERIILRQLDLADAGLVSMAGSGVSQFDMRWLAKWMPELHARLTYYSIDMGTFERTMSVLANGEMPAKRSGIAHRAVEDILFSHGLAVAYSELFNDE